MPKFKILSSVALAFGRWGLSILKKRFVAKLPDGQTKTDLNVLFERVEELIRLFTDSDPEDAKQLDVLWRKVVGGDLTASATARVEKLVAGLDDPRLGKTILAVTRPGIDVLALVSDEDPDDKEQILARLKAFANDPGTHDLVFYQWLEPALKGAGVPDFVVSVLFEAIADGIEGVLDPVPTVKSMTFEKRAIVVHLRTKAADLAA